MNEIAEERKRIETVHKFELLDTPADGSFDKMVELAAKVFNVPIAIISLVDTDRIWFKSHFGLEAQQIPRSPGLCASAILSDNIYIVEDARNDPRTLSNPLVASDFGLQFYAAVPLKTSDGYNLGTFCIIDKKKRYLNLDQQQMLKLMGHITMQEMEMRLQSRIVVKEYNRRMQDWNSTGS